MIDIDMNFEGFKIQNGGLKGSHGGMPKSAQILSAQGQIVLKFGIMIVMMMDME